MKKRFNSIPGFVVIILFIVCTVNSNAATYHFSSTAGDDSRSAAQAQNENTPWKSIQKLNSIFQTLQPGDRILFKSGDSFPGEIIVTKSGNQGAPIFFGSYGSGPKPIITGLTKIQNWTTKGANIYEANVPQVNTPINVVVVDNEIKAKGRFPNENAPNKGYLMIESINGGTISSSQFQAPSNFSGAEVVIRKNNWIIDRHTINSHSGTSLNYNTAGSGYNPKVGFGFFIQNHPSTLDQNGEWYHDVQNNKILLYYDKGNPNNRIEVATINEIVNIQNNVGNLTFNNLRITGSNKNLVNLRSSANVLFENCELEFIGENAIEGKGTNNLTISNSKIQNALNGGIFLGWSDKGLKVTNNTFTNIFNFAGMSKNGDMQGQSIYMSESSSNGLIENNSFFNNGYIVINFNGNNTIIRNNYINTFNTVKDDGAAIYTYTGSGNVTFVNRKVINNIIINGIGAQEGTKPYGVNDFPYVEGIYMDDNSSGVEISGNTIANVRSAGIFLHNARNIDILNNNVYNVGYSLKFSHDNLGDPIRNITIRNNFFVQKSAEQMHVFAISKVDDIAQMGVFENNVFSKPVNEYSNFIVQIPSGRSTIDLEDWQKRYGKDQTSKRSPVQIPDGKITAVNSGNKIINGTYNANNNNSFCWSTNNDCEVSVIENSPLDGRALKVNFPSPGILTINVGNIEKNKKYNLKFSIIANKKIILNSYLRENQTPWNRISNQNSFEVSTSRSEINKIFTASETRNNAVLVLESSDTDITYHIDNVVLEEVEVEEVKIEDFIFFDYNRSNSSKNVSLPGTFTDLRGNSVGSNTSIPSYNSILLLRTDNNYPPENNDIKIKIIEPSNFQKFEEGEIIKIKVEIEKSNLNTIEKVEIFKNGLLVTTLIQEPYEFDLENQTPGEFKLFAKAYDNQSKSFESEIVTISVEKKKLNRL